ncbi:hypothetical protein J1G44_06760 [Cellulomonas sp. zg-ZUI199]|uniref:TIGR04222 domain-containing membrane protein n=1 Tax=Cellulomonas wangleii TaxID=2816956 RepID=A0ABX8D6V2_9CELL|nr:hypothetical protein [Cellulomonas wangleii]MBO0923899.1 hypothetical protein [Cellulomonas wangleii]MBO0924181.1 hypothetical protein [Cellulomonas wangleii]QVI62201.1 hypothetical protein KG103_17605 [Cellulomonas wangleii]
MTALRRLVRAVWDAGWRPLAVGAAVAALAWALGMRTSSALVLGLAAATLTAVLQRVDSLPEPRPARRVQAARDGGRGEVLDVAWSMVGRDGRVTERALRPLRAAGARRVARHGLDLTDDRQADALTGLLGRRAYGTLARRGHPTPTVGDLTHTLGVLERLGASRSRTAAPHDPPAADARHDPDPRSPR